MYRPEPGRAELRSSIRRTKSKPDPQKRERGLAPTYLQQKSRRVGGLFVDVIAYSISQSRLNQKHVKGGETTDDGEIVAVLRFPFEANSEEQDRMTACDAARNGRSALAMFASSGGRISTFPRSQRRQFDAKFPGQFWL